MNDSALCRSAFCSRAIFPARKSNPKIALIDGPTHRNLGFRSLYGLLSRSIRQTDQSFRPPRGYSGSRHAQGKSGSPVAEVLLGPIREIGDNAALGNNVVLAPTITGFRQFRRVPLTQARPPSTRPRMFERLGAAHTHPEDGPSHALPSRGHEELVQEG
jgi:hypothetical protein